jgi:hypothetical protein
MLELITQLEHRHSLKIVVVSTESRAVNGQRIRTFKLDQLADTFISSCFVRIRKPDVDITNPLAPSCPLSDYRRTVGHPENRASNLSGIDRMTAEVVTQL